MVLIVGLLVCIPTWEPTGQGALPSREHLARWKHSRSLISGAPALDDRATTAHEARAARGRRSPARRGASATPGADAARRSQWRRVPGGERGLPPPEGAVVGAREPPPVDGESCERAPRLPPPPPAQLPAAARPLARPPPQVGGRRPQPARPRRLAPRPGRRAAQAPPDTPRAARARRRLVLARGRLPPTGGGGPDSAPTEGTYRAANMEETPEAGESWESAGRRHKRAPVPSEGPGVGRSPGAPSAGGGGRGRSDRGGGAPHPERASPPGPSGERRLGGRPRGTEKRVQPPLFGEAQLDPVPSGISVRKMSPLGLTFLFPFFSACPGVRGDPNAAP
nr:proline-rich protein 2-like [Dasypus novemcinctus]